MALRRAAGSRDRLRCGGGWRGASVIIRREGAASALEPTQRRVEGAMGYYNESWARSLAGNLMRLTMSRWGELMGWQWVSRERQWLVMPGRERGSEFGHVPADGWRLASAAERDSSSEMPSDARIDAFETACASDHLPPRPAIHSLAWPVCGRWPMMSRGQRLGPTASSNQRSAAVGTRDG